jgi:hypothetical protein
MGHRLRQRGDETGSYPGQPWLWLYTLWYQVNWDGSTPESGTGTEQVNPQSPDRVAS